MGLAFVLSFLFCLPVRALTSESLEQPEAMSIHNTLHLITLRLRLFLGLAWDTCLYWHVFWQQMSEASENLNCSLPIGLCPMIVKS